MARTGSGQRRMTAEFNRRKRETDRFVKRAFPSAGIRGRVRFTSKGGGLVASIFAVLGGIMWASCLLTWWLIKIVIWCMYMMGLYAFKGIRYVVLLIVGKLRKETPEE